jgi:tetratricopeptide (TPR) repeat protein
MLTMKNSGTTHFQAALASICVAFICGCQPSGPKSLLLGAKYIHAGDYPRALKHLDKAAELLPAHPQVWNHLGLAWHGAGEPSKAAEAYQRALRIDQRLAPAHFNLGVLLLEQGRAADAVGALTAFVSLQPTNAAGFSKLGAALLQARRHDEAERALNQALRLNPKDAEARNSLGMVHVQRKRPRDAMLEFNAALRERPGFPAALLNQAIVAQQFFANNEMALERYRAFLDTGQDQRQLHQVRLLVARLEDSARAKPFEVASLPETNRFNIPHTATANNDAPRILEKTNARVAEAALSTNLLAQPAPGTNVAAPPANVSLVKTAAPPATIAGTNAARLARPSVAATNKPPPVEVDEPPIPVQVVEVASEPEFKAPTDVAAQPKETQLAAARPAPPARETPHIAPRRDRESDSESRPSFLDRANPMRWFRGEEKPPPPSIRSPIPSGPSRRDASTPRLVPPQFARYRYQKSASVVKGNRAEAEKLFVQGARAHQERRLGAAIAAYRQAVAADPSYFDAQYNLGLAAMQMKDLPLALAANEMAVQIKPGSVDARYHFAVTLRDANYPVDAANELRDLLVEAPDELRAHFALANLYAQLLDESALAGRHYRRVLELAPNHPEASAIRQWLAARG